MNDILIRAVIVVTFALACYSIAIVTEQRKYFYIKTGFDLFNTRSLPGHYIYNPDDHRIKENSDNNSWFSWLFSIVIYADRYDFDLEILVKES